MLLLRLFRKGFHIGGLFSKKFSTVPFAGATKYVSYKNGTRTFLYANYDISKKITPWDFLALIVLVPIILANIVMMFTSVSHPRKLTGTDKNIIIDDRASVFDMTGGLESSLNSFLKKTGITPAVITVNNEDWRSDYSDFKDYVRVLYETEFDDESHWLIVYSRSKKSALFDDWNWAAAQGKDTDKILTDKIWSQFSESMQSHLSDNTQFTVSSAISRSFTDILPVVMKTEVFGMGLFFTGAMLVFLLAICYFLFKPQIRSLKYNDAVVCPLVVTEDNCEKCGGIYVVGTCSICPHCGAKLKPHVYTEEEKNAVAAFAAISKKQ